MRHAVQRAAWKTTSMLEASDESSKPVFSMQGLPKDGAYRRGEGRRATSSHLAAGRGFPGPGLAPDPGCAEAQPRRLSLPARGGAPGRQLPAMADRHCRGQPGLPPGADQAPSGTLCHRRPGSARCVGRDCVGDVRPGSAGAGCAGRVHAAPCQRPDRRRKGVDAGPGGLGSCSRGDRLGRRNHGCRSALVRQDRPGQGHPDDGMGADRLRPRDDDRRCVGCDLPALQRRGGVPAGRESLHQGQPDHLQRGRLRRQQL